MEDSYANHLNTPRAVFDQNQQTVWRWDQTEPFADSVPDENPSGLGVFEMPLRRAGEYADKETGDFYNYFRTLDPAIDRYQQSDLVGLAAGVNTYARVLSDPLSRIDPLAFGARSAITRAGAGSSSAGTP